jgi:hypothetical protein
MHVLLATSIYVAMALLGGIVLAGPKTFNKENMTKAFRVFFKGDRT